MTESIIKQEHYGTVARWFDRRQLGSIQSSSDEIDQHIFLIAENLPDYYRTPQVGDEIVYRIAHDEKKRLIAKNIEPLPPPKEGGIIRVTLQNWDLSRNCGFGIYGLRKQVPVFALGQFLRDQLRIPEQGDVLEGRLKKHGDQQWMLTDICIIDRVEMPEAVERTRLPESKETEPSSYIAKEPQVVLSNVQQDKDNQLFPAFMVFSGRIVRWDERQGCGFIRRGEDGKEVLFHAPAYFYRKLKPAVGQMVSFYCNRPIADAPQQAVRVVLKEHESVLIADEVYDDRSMIEKAGVWLASLAGGGMYLLLVASLSWKLALFYLLMSVLAFLCCYQDTYRVRSSQRQAKSPIRLGGFGQRLCQWNILGGWPGGLLMRPLQKHQYRTQSFIMLFGLTVLANLILTYLLLIHFADHPWLALLSN